MSLGASLAAGSGALFARSAKRQPNILWIVTDDQRADSLSCYNRAVRGEAESELGYVLSPNVNRLASEGVLFTRAYCNSPACAPSRASMHTGLYPHHNGIFGFERSHQKAKCAKPTVPQIMRRQGYTTAHFGKSGYYIFKWGPGLTWESAGLYDVAIEMKKGLAKQGLTDFLINRPWQKGKQIGTEECWHYPDGAVKRYFVERKIGKLTENDKQKQREVEGELDILRAYTRRNTNLIIGGQSPQPTDKTLDGQIVAAFENYLRNRGKSYATAWGEEGNGPNPDKPLFAHLGFHFPHTPVLPSREYRDRFKGKTYRVPEFSKDELKRLPPQLVTIFEKMNFADLKPEDKQQAIRDYYAFCAMGDRLTGRAVKAVKEYSRETDRDYLIVFVCGDHGWHLGEQGIEAKFGPWDTSNHDAVVVVSSDKSKFPPGKVYDGFVEFVDFAPTFFKAAGIDTRQKEYRHLDGYPLDHILAGRTVPREYVLGEMSHVCGPRAYVRGKEFAFSMRVRRKNGRPGFGYRPGEDVRWALDAPRDDVEMALYDLRIDPKERRNVADDEAYMKLADWFRQKLGNIVLGDGRLECDWRNENDCAVSNFAKGADDKKLRIPRQLIPEPSLP